MATHDASIRTVVTPLQRTEGEIRRPSAAGRVTYRAEGLVLFITLSSLSPATPYAMSLPLNGRTPFSVLIQLALICFEPSPHASSSYANSCQAVRYSNAGSPPKPCSRCNEPMAKTGCHIPHKAQEYIMPFRSRTYAHASLPRAGMATKRRNVSQNGNISSSNTGNNGGGAGGSARRQRKNCGTAESSRLPAREY